MPRIWSIFLTMRKINTNPAKHGQEEFFGSTNRPNSARLMYVSTADETLKKWPLTWLAAFEWYIVDIILLNKNFEWRLHCSFCSADGYAKRSKVPILTVHHDHFVGTLQQSLKALLFSWVIGWMGLNNGNAFYLHGLQLAAGLLRRAGSWQATLNPGCFPNHPNQVVFVIWYWSGAGLSCWTSAGCGHTITVRYALKFPTLVVWMIWELDCIVHFDCLKRPRMKALLCKQQNCNAFILIK